MAEPIGYSSDEFDVPTGIKPVSLRIVPDPHNMNEANNGVNTHQGVYLETELKALDRLVGSGNQLLTDKQIEKYMLQTRGSRFYINFMVPTWRNLWNHFNPTRDRCIRELTQEYFDYLPKAIHVATTSGDIITEVTDRILNYFPTKSKALQDKLAELAGEKPISSDVAEEKGRMRFFHNLRWPSKNDLVNLGLGVAAGGLTKSLVSAGLASTSVGSLGGAVVVGAIGGAAVGAAFGAVKEASAQVKENWNSRPIDPNETFRDRLKASASLRNLNGKRIAIACAKGAAFGALGGLGGSFVADWIQGFIEASYTPVDSAVLGIYEQPAAISTVEPQIVQQLAVEEIKLETALANLDVTSEHTAEVEAYGEEIIPSFETYVVKTGDSLWKIAESYGNPFAYHEIAKVNNLLNPSVIHKDNELIIPLALFRS